MTRSAAAPERRPAREGEPLGPATRHDGFLAFARMTTFSNVDDDKD